MNLKEMFPKLLSTLDDDINDLRYFIVVDENYEDIDDEELDIFDPNDYNYLIYITELTQKLIGDEVLNRLPKELEKRDIFTNFIESEIDLYGVMSELDDRGVAIEVLKVIEGML